MKFFIGHQLRPSIIQHSVNVSDFSFYVEGFPLDYDTLMDGHPYLLNFAEIFLPLVYTIPIG